jgi:hypothetical protein
MKFTDAQINRMAQEALRQLRRTPKTPSRVRRLDPHFFELDPPRSKTVLTSAGEEALYDRAERGALTDDEVKMLIEHEFRSQLTAAINRITGKVD